MTYCESSEWGLSVVEDGREVALLPWNEVFDAPLVHLESADLGDTHDGVIQIALRTMRNALTKEGVW